MAAVPRAPRERRRGAERSEVGELEPPFVGPRSRAASAQGALPQRRGREACEAAHGRWASRGIGKSRLGVGVREVPRRARRARSGGIGAAVSPTATVSPTGRSPRCSGCARASPRTRRQRTRSPKLVADARRARARRGRAQLARAATLPPARPRRPRSLRAAEISSRRGGSSSSGSPTTGPVALVFEDLQWADASLLDFVEHLLDWSRSHPIFVLALRDQRSRSGGPGWGAAGRSCDDALARPAADRRRWTS